MSRKTSPAVTSGTHSWRQLFEAALLERDNSLMPRRMKDAKDAVLDRITCDSIDSTSPSERKLLLAALNTISELQRLGNLDELPATAVTPALGQAA
jgi:hypothetical protein